MSFNNFNYRFKSDIDIKRKGNIYKLNMLMSSLCFWICPNLNYIYIIMCKIYCRESNNINYKKKIKI